MESGISAFGWGIVSAVSLPAGALIGILFRPGRRINSAFMAFGAGALLFALTIELFGEAIQESESVGPSIVFFVMGGAILGGLIFDLLNRILNSRGAFARSISTAKRYLLLQKKTQTEVMVEQLSKIQMLASLPPKIIAELIPSLKPETYLKGEEIFHQGDAGDALYFIVGGKVSIIADSENESREIAQLTENDIFGEIALFSDIPRTATALCLEETSVYRLSHRRFVHLMDSRPDVKAKFSSLVRDRVKELHSKVSSRTSKKWSNAVNKRLARFGLLVSDEDIKTETTKVIQKGGGAALAIWLGILIDTIPESMVIGMLTKSITGVSLAFIAGVFLANLPEAMSSSTTMLKGGMTTKRIVFMWSSLMILTGIGAFAGAVLFPADP